MSLSMKKKYNNRDGAPARTGVQVKMPVAVAFDNASSSSFEKSFHHGGTEYTEGNLYEFLRELWVSVVNGLQRVSGFNARL